MNMNEITTQLPEDYISIGEDCVVHLSTIETFTEDVASFLDYLAIASDYPSVGNPETMKEITIRCSAPTCEVAERMREHGKLMLAVVKFLEDGYWPNDRPQPLFLIGSSTDSITYPMRTEHNNAI